MKMPALTGRANGAMCPSVPGVMYQTIAVHSSCTSELGFRSTIGARTPAVAWHRHLQSWIAAGHGTIIISTEGNQTLPRAIHCLPIRFPLLRTPWQRCRPAQSNELFPAIGQLCMSSSAAMQWGRAIGGHRLAKAPSVT